MATLWLQVRVRRADQPSVAPPYRVALFTYKTADVIDVPHDVTDVSDEPVQGDVLPALIKTEGAVKAVVAVKDASLAVIVQLLGWHVADDGEPAPSESEWKVLETIDDKKGNITIEAKYPRARLGAS